jgi:hypothetical protein
VQIPYQKPRPTRSPLATALTTPHTHTARVYGCMQNPNEQPWLHKACTCGGEDPGALVKKHQAYAQPSGPNHMLCPTNTSQPYVMPTQHIPTICYAQPTRPNHMLCPIFMPQPPVMPNQHVPTICYAQPSCPNHLLCPTNTSPPYGMPNLHASTTCYAQPTRPNHMLCPTIMPQAS